MKDTSTTILPDNSEFDTLEKYIKWMETRVNSLEQFMLGKDKNDYPCMECSRNELRQALAHAKNITALK